MSKAVHTPKIPSADSIGELKKFWDTHDFTGFEEQMEPIEKLVFSRKVMSKSEPTGERQSYGQQ